MKLLFVRHGKDDGRFRGGWSTRDLLPEGVEQAKKLASYLNASEYRIRKIISSDLVRTWTTARILAEKLSLPVIKDEGLREMNNGLLAGMANEEALARYPGLYFNTLGIDECYPGGESPRMFYERIQSWFANFLQVYQDFDGDILIVTHGGVINILYHIVKRFAWSNRAKGFRASTCGLHVLNLETMTFEVENETKFL